MKGGQGLEKWAWSPDYYVVAVGYDIPIPGFNTLNTIALRLWSSRPSREFDLMTFNRGDYYGAIDIKQKSEKISSILYPSDGNYYFPPRLYEYLIIRPLFY